jgi:nifR3 family TIM-barrel protein
MQIDLREPWAIDDVVIPTRLVLAPMAGLSVQAFRRQGRRYGAGLVCSEMVSCAGIHFRNERTLGYLRVGADERPLAVQIFGSEPALMAEAAQIVEAAGADIVDLNFGCPVRKVTKTGAGATLLEQPELACRIVAAVAGAVVVPVTVKMRRGLENGSRTCLELGPRLVDAGARSLTLHPRSARQMYTGAADHTLTAELVRLVDVPVVASGDVTSHQHAVRMLADTGAAAVMVGRAAQGNRGPCARSSTAMPASRPGRRSPPSSSCSSAKPCGSSESGALPASSRSSTAGTWAAAASPPFVGLVGLKTTDEVVGRLLLARRGRRSWSTGRSARRRKTRGRSCRSPFLPTAGAEVPDSPSTPERPLSRQLRLVGPVVLVSFAAVGTVYLLAYGLAKAFEREPILLTEDPANIFDSPPYTAAFQYVGFLGWWAAAVLSGTAALLLRANGRNDVAMPLGGLSFISMLLLLDDMFLVHESVLDAHLGIPQSVTFIAYAVAATWFFWHVREFVLRSDWLLLVMPGPARRRRSSMMGDVLATTRRPSRAWSCSGSQPGRCAWRVGLATSRFGEAAPVLAVEVPDETGALGEAGRRSRSTTRAARSARRSHRWRWQAHQRQARRGSRPIPSTWPAKP